MIGNWICHRFTINCLLRKLWAELLLSRLCLQHVMQQNVTICRTCDIPKSSYAWWSCCMIQGLLTNWFFHSEELCHLAEDLRRAFMSESVVVAWRLIFREGKNFYDANDRHFYSFVRESNCWNIFNGVFFNIVIILPNMTVEALNRLLWSPISVLWKT